MAIQDRKIIWFTPAAVVDPQPPWEVDFSNARCPQVRTQPQDFNTLEGVHEDGSEHGAWCYENTNITFKTREAQPRWTLTGEHDDVSKGYKGRKSA